MKTMVKKLINNKNIIENNLMKTIQYNPSYKKKLKFKIWIFR